MFLGIRVVDSNRLDGIVRVSDAFDSTRVDRGLNHVG
jgi:hypothetical protein